MTVGFDMDAPVRQVRLQLQRRRWMVTAGLLGAVIVAFAVALMLGDYPVPPDAVVRSLLSRFTGEVNRGVDFIVLDVRLPRATMAVLSGVAFGVAGIIFQTILRNPLASPDIIGITYGASAAAVFCIIVLGLSGSGVSLGALVGALGTALAIYLLAWRGSSTTYRVVLIGIGIAAIMSAAMSYLFTRARINEAQEALAWLVGSLNATTGAELLPLSLALLVLLPAVALLQRQLEPLQLGDDTATALGARTERSRVLLLLLAVALSAMATAAVGPVGFVAFVSGPIARALLGGAGKGVAQAGLVGAGIVLGGDMVAQHAIPDVQLPVGVVTGLFGALFLLWLLVASNRAGRVT